MTPTNGAGGEPVEGALLHVGDHVVGVGERERGGEEGARPARHLPDVRGGLPESQEAEQVLGEAPADEHHHQAEQHEPEQQEGRADVERLAAQEAAPLARELEDDVQSAAGGLQRSRGAVERERQAQDEAGGRGALALERAAQRAVERLDHRRRRHALEVVHDRVVGLGVLPEQAEQREREQRRREQRHQHVVRERRGVVGHLVVVERDQRALEDAGASSQLARARGRDSARPPRPGRSGCGRSRAPPRCPRARRSGCPGSGPR